jgi:hypothetical protein
MKKPIEGGVSSRQGDCNCTENGAILTEQPVNVLLDRRPERRVMDR